MSFKTVLGKLLTSCHCLQDCHSSSARVKRVTDGLHLVTATGKCYIVTLMSCSGVAGNSSLVEVLQTVLSWSQTIPRPSDCCADEEPMESLVLCSRHRQAQVLPRSKVHSFVCWVYCRKAYNTQNRDETINCISVWYSIAKWPA